MGSTGPSYRTANRGDVDQLAEAYSWLVAPPGRVPEGWEENRAKAAIGRAIAGSESSFIVALSGPKLVGFASVYLDLDSVRFGRRAWVEDLAVHPAHRSQGIGKHLLDAAKSWARARGATHLGLESSEARVDAHRFYERERPSSRSKSYGWVL
ncbi:MAG: GNAT family N-acetyltransferase [Thermoplasmata archaeon]|nr:GNAT family N-acetyltransferase [Thermoplasmata archaeon]